MPILENFQNWVRKSAQLGEIKTLLKIEAPGPTSSVSFEAVLTNKDESRIG